MAAIIIISTSVFANIEINTYNYSPAPAEAGKKFTLWVQIKNDSVKDAQNVIVELDLEYPFALTETETGKKTIDSIRTNQIGIVRFELQTDSLAIEGTYNIGIKMGKDGKHEKKETKTIDVTAGAPELKLTETSEYTFEPGETKEIALTLKNIGKETAHDIIIQFTEDRTVTTAGTVVEREITPLKTASAYIKQINPGQQQTAIVTLSANPKATLKNHTLPVTIQFKDSKGASHTSSAYIGLKVHANAELNAVINTTEPKPFPSGTSEITIDLYNTGAASASYLTLELISNEILFEKTTSFIGTLEADDFDSFKTKATIPPTMQTGNHPIKIKLTYRDNENKKIEEEKTLPFNIVTFAEANTGQDAGITGTLIGIITTILMLVGLYVTTKKVISITRKKKHELG
jgi:hypothetical protein